MPMITTAPTGSPAPVQPAAPGSASAPAASAANNAEASGFTGSDFQTFLRMLTTQIQNQDPLNPIESSDFAVQLATFSGVEQQVRTNQLLESLNAQRAGGLDSAAGWIGKEVRTTAPVAYDGRPISLSIEPASGATSVQLVTLDALGKEVQRQTLPARAGEVAWDSRNGAGTALPNGLYSFKLVSLKGEDILHTGAVGAYARVTGAELTSKGVSLILPGGASTLESEVTALRSPA
ncbi:flagellar hook capping FlgD N-terminal domain-containing protein [Paracoccus contaminans]|uniref:Basal-body rod modification protein FlgD n=1 Tax=Paracoccus contaminans TaxID=1945662 RepID=A0A1W6CY90_9RHOB|nr:flagellar hook capping FlgD N-terminal domain-containing protein [Paracoccus contaminans]ARJ69820.1 hypothetical protein B0A89_09500 [Paracoccus contaminans]